MECRTAQLLLQIVAPRTGELDKSEALALEEHLAGCSACAESAGVESAFDESVAGWMLQVPVPPDLQARLHSKVALEGRRIVYHAWFRRARQFSAAAAILLTAWLGFAYWKYSTRPIIDVPQLNDEVVVFLRQPPAAMEAWFTTQCG